jgi:hypothetical protein
MGVTAGVLSAWMAPDVRTWLAASQAPDAVVAAASSWERIAQVAGFPAARSAVDGAGDRLLFSPKVLNKRQKVVPGAGTPVSEPAAQPAVVAPAPAPQGPGERWVGPDDEGGGRVDSVLLVGASSMQYYLGTELETRLETEYPGLRVERLGKLGTGLVRNDVFDWPGEIAKLAAEHQPDVVVMQFGGNDAQPFLVGEKRIQLGTDEWDALYQERLVSLAGQVAAVGAVPVFVGLSTMRDEGFNGRIARVNRVTEGAALVAGARYISTWDIGADEKGNYGSEVSYQGRRGLMRMEDGVHFSRLGAQYAADRLVIRLEQHVSLVHPDPALAVPVTRWVESTARSKRTPYLAFVPRDVPKEGLPALVLLHGAWDGWTAWSEHAHRDLQRLATEHKVILVFPDGEPHGWYLDSDRVPGNQIDTYLYRELLPDIREYLPVNGQLGVMGLSMGGHGALLAAIRHPGTFRSVSSLSGAVDLSVAKDRKALQDLLGPYEDAPESWQTWSVVHQVAARPAGLRGVPLRLHCGTADSRWIAPNRALHAALETNGVAHTWEEVPGGHTWDVWLKALPEHVAWHAGYLHAPATRPETP